MEKDKELRENKPTNTRLKMTIGILCLVILSVVELYLMINYSDSYLFLGLVGLAILCSVYWVTDLSFKIRREQESSFEKDMESLYKAQKVSYITVKQGFTKLEELLDELGEDLSVPVDELLQAQKAVGRVTIQKNKENIDEYIASNEKLIEHLQAFEEKFAEIGERIEAISPMASMSVPELGSDRQEEILNSLTRMESVLQESAGGAPSNQQQVLDALSEIEDLLRREFGREPVKDRQQEILDYLARIESSVRDEISELEVHMESKIDEIPSAVQEEQKMSPEELERILGETSALMDTVQLDLTGESETAKTELISNEVMAAEDFEIPKGMEMPKDAVTAENFEIPKDVVTAEDFEIPEGMEIPKDAVTAEDFEIPKGMEMPVDAVAAEEYEIPEGMEIPKDAVTAEDFEIPEGMEMPKDASMAEDFEIPEGMAISADAVTEDKFAILENLEAPEAADESGILGESAISEEFGLSDNLMMPETAVDMAEPEPVEMPEKVSAEATSEHEQDMFTGSEKVMTPEEIAALLGESEVPEEAAEEEEKLPMPDLSDPGHVMTPEEIAALVANM